MLLATEIPGFFFLSFLRREKVTFCSKRLQKYSSHVFICTSCQHILRVRILQLAKNKVKTTKLKSTNHTTEKTHLTKSRNFQHQISTFHIAGLYKQVCPQQLMKNLMLAVMSAIPVSSTGYQYVLNSLPKYLQNKKRNKKRIHNYLFRSST